MTHFTWGEIEFSRYGNNNVYLYAKPIHFRMDIYALIRDDIGVRASSL